MSCVILLDVNRTTVIEFLFSNIDIDEIKIIRCTMSNPISLKYWMTHVREDPGPLVLVYSM